jgi:hypothetical protein
MLYVFASQDALTEGAGVRCNRRPVLACTGPRKRRRRLVLLDRRGRPRHFLRRAERDQGSPRQGDDGDGARAAAA